MKKLLILFVSIFFLSEAVAQKNDNPAFFLKTNKKKIEIIVEAAKFYPGESVADIGAGLGWVDAALGIYQDSLNFSLEDIDSSFQVKSRLQEALTEYSKERERPITCSYTYVIGTEQSTLLPDTTFDKVLLIDTYHHLKYRDEMISDIFRILKPGGKLIVHEPVGNKPNVIYKPCRSLIQTSDELISYIREKGFDLEGMFDNGRSAGEKVKVFVFGRW